MSSYSRRMAITVGQNVREIRNQKRWTAAELAEKTEELGNLIKRSYILDLENEKRAKQITVADWLTLAKALSIEPTRLLTEPGSSSRIETSPNNFMTHNQVIRFASLLDEKYQVLEKLNTFRESIETSRLGEEE